MDPFPLPVEDEQIFSRHEQSLLHAVPPDKVGELGYQLWVRKEAVAKCLGLGVTMRLAELDSWRSGDSWVTASANPDNVAYLDIAVGDGYVGALAISAPPARILRLEWDASVVDQL
jgi:phosphopantetheinyl transferase